MKKLTEAFVRKLIKDCFLDYKITFSRMVEIMNEEVASEDISDKPKPKSFSSAMCIHEWVYYGYPGNGHRECKKCKQVRDL